jgi:hypothetical protein
VQQSYRMSNGHLVTHFWNLLVFQLKKDRMDGCMPSLHTLLCCTCCDILHNTYWKHIVSSNYHCFDYSSNSYSNSNGTIDRIVMAFTNQKPQLLLFIHPQYIWVIDYNIQLTWSTHDAVYWTRNHLILLTIVPTLTPTL